jgi:excinuclease UvrABC nuclease subunit
MSIHFMKKFYVYKVSHNDEIVYVGKGQSNRWQHVLGKSSNQQLNQLYYHCKFTSTKIPNVTFEMFHTEKEALQREHFLIYTLKPKFNTLNKYTPPQDYVFEEEFIVDDMWGF